MSDEGSSEGLDKPTERTRGPIDRRRLARWVAIAGALALVVSARWLVFPHVPRERDIEIQLPSPRDEVIGVDIRWSAAGSTEDITMTSLRFPVGSAPASVRTRVKLPDGAYDVAIAVERGSTVDSTRRRISLADADRVTIPLR